MSCVVFFAHPILLTVIIREVGIQHPLLTADVPPGEENMPVN
jgi:hypothetical protein